MADDVFEDGEKLPDVAKLSEEEDIDVNKAASRSLDGDPRALSSRPPEELH